MMTREQIEKNSVGIMSDSDKLAADLRGAGSKMASVIELVTGVAPEGDLAETPMRYVRALREMTRGYDMDPAAILSKTFAVDHDEMVVVRGIRFTSVCEHHLLPFPGVAHVAYVPGEKIVGLSKLARLVTCFAMRLQVQERMTTQIVRAIQDHLQPKGAGVIVCAKHSCMGHRGARQPDAAMVTSSMVGCLKDDPASRAELMRLVDVGVSA